MPNVLADRHHSGLFHSIQLLAKRLGWTLYTPHGHEWWDEFYWSFGRSTYLDDRLAVQFLMTPEVPDNEFPDWPIDYVSLEQAREMDWAYVMASVPDNQDGFARFARERGAQYLLQVGNTGQYVDWDLDPLALVSSEMPILGRGIYYRQEIEPTPYVSWYMAKRRYGKTWTHPAASFVNCMPSMGRCWDTLQAMSFPVCIFGIDGDEGVLKPNSDLVATMSAHAWGYHDKAQGDGFGHVIHQWASVGRPLIGHASHYAGLMAEPFWIDGETCIDLDRHDVQEVGELVATMPPERHRAMCEAIRNVFDATVDYDAEEERIRAFLGL